MTDKDGVRKMQEYLRFCEREVRKRFDAGLSVRDAAHDIALGDYSSWPDAERIAVNVDTLYREYRGETGGPTDALGLFALMSELRR
jgi:cyclase